jgi:dGTPase
MFDRVYINSEAKAEEGKAEYMIEQLYEYYLCHIEQLPEEYVRMIQEKPESASRFVCDFIAGMTDRYAVMKYQNLTIPRTWSVF